jgi:superfamily II DNA/RNA helicase
MDQSNFHTDCLKASHRIIRQFPQRVRNITNLKFPHLKFIDLLNALMDIENVQDQLYRIVILTKEDHTALKLNKLLRESLFFNTTVLHGKRKEKRKKRAIENFNSGKTQILIVSSSGMTSQTENIHFYINYDTELIYEINPRRRMRNIG